MSTTQALLHISAICFVGAIFLEAVNWFEPNRLVAIIFNVPSSPQAQRQS
jgi:hypothetical protein